MPKKQEPKLKKWNILWTDNSLLTYDLTTKDVETLFKSMEDGKIFARTSIGMIRVEDIRHVVEYIEPKKISDAPALPLMSDEELRETLRVIYADRDREEVEQWLEQLKGEDLQSAAEWAMHHPL